ncbi:hypothetical protein M2272_005696 [Mycobacterium frederiksbergense]|uniref:Uncharacterized protein n=1 Tax=Mycolicibacterium frederiksbergense TaxID=117567 RepID=A0ABT6L7Y7_9MYCO|nr:hypothetical protein [Mycolicibacterium frederiksbergense]MDH6199029.1 hypothetical protein [Mycolicibacterium frederiksbergense]
MIKFAKPSPLRALVCVAVVTVFMCVVVGIAISTAMIVGSSDPAPLPTGEYVRLFIVNITMWGPIMLITAWFLSVPVILAAGLLVACIHVVDPPREDEAETEADARGAHRKTISAPNTDPVPRTAQHECY